jgi:hypothetical protein
MTCAYCKREIGRKAIDAHHYSRSTWTGLHYCCRPDCPKVGRRLVELEKAASHA